MYNGEELIDVSKVDINDEEVMKKISSTLSDIYYDGIKCFKKIREQNDVYMDAALKAVGRSNVETIEKRKTIISKILYIVGSAFHPETMPVEMYGKQTMPEATRRRFNLYNEKANQFYQEVKTSVELLAKFQGKYDDMWKKAFSSNEGKLDILNKMNNMYKSTKATDKNIDTDIIYNIMLNYGYITKEDFSLYASNGVALIDTNIRKKLNELNNWYANEYSEQKSK